MHEPQELHGSNIGLYQYRKVFLASLLNHLAVAAQPLVSLDLRCLLSLPLCTWIMSTSENSQLRKSILFSYLGLESPILALLCILHANAMESIWRGKVYYLQAYNLKKATQVDLFFFLNEQNPQIQCGLCQKEEAMLIPAGKISKDNFTFVFPFSHSSFSNLFPLSFSTK